MARHFFAAVALLLLWCLPGCFTILSQIVGKPPGSRVFSGTRLHSDEMVNKPMGYWLPRVVLIGWVPLDFPLSFVADIVILPYTTPMQLIYGDFPKKKTEADEIIGGSHYRNP